MANNQRLIIGIAVVAVVIAVIAIAVLLTSSSSTPGTTVANVASSTAAQTVDTERTQIYGEMTSTGQAEFATNQAGNQAATVVAMQATINALSNTQVPQVQQQQPTLIGAPQQALSTAAPQIITATPQRLQQPTVDMISEVGDWTDSQNINISSGSITLGDSAGWVVFQVWDGQSAATTVHGVIEPGRKVIIPAPLKGTYWTVTHITYEAVTARALTMRDEALQQGTAGTAPPILYIGSQNHVPQGYSIQIPSGWTVQ